MKSSLKLQSSVLAAGMASLGAGFLDGPQYDLWGNRRGKHKLGSVWFCDKAARKKRNKVAKASRAKNRG